MNRFNHNRIKLHQLRTLVFVLIEEQLIGLFEATHNYKQAHRKLNNSLKMYPTESILPKSLQLLIEDLSQEEKEYILTLREKILAFDENLIEVGRTTSTEYGLCKEKNDIYKTKMCARFIPIFPGFCRPRLLLLLPYPKKEFGGPGRTYKIEPVKGMAWAQVPLAEDKTLQFIYFYLGKSLRKYSFMQNFATYSQVYRNLTGLERNLAGTHNLIDLALDEWRERTVSS
jgi:hypothetical protein